ncbi:hypothetical protein STEG23_022155, partial [Scotinomys teguina]
MSSAVSDCQTKAKEKQIKRPSSALGIETRAIVHTQFFKRQIQHGVIADSNKNGELNSAK